MYDEKVPYDPSAPVSAQDKTPEDHESLGQRAMDLLVYAPTGLVVTAIEELPSLVAKGKERLAPQMRSAHAVGRFTVDFGAKQMERKASQLLRRPAAPAATQGEGASGPRPSRPPGGPQTHHEAPEAKPAHRPKAAGAPRPAPAHQPPAESRPTVDLAIPGYDTLSASQVVRRLDGLGPAELEAVRRYEAGARGRRTILHRIHQILEEQGHAGEQPGS